MAAHGVPPDRLWYARAVFAAAWRPIMNSLTMHGMPNSSTQPM